MAYQFQNVSVLVVDDMKPMLMVVVKVLQILGFKKIDTSMETDDAFIKFCQYNHDIVITDWQVPPYDGIELIEKIRNDPASPNKFVPIILMTGYSARLRVMEARDRGVTEFMVKPFSAKDMFLRIEQLIERPRKFIDAKQFFGPDRRRRKTNEYGGPRRRNVDASLSPEQNRQRIDEILDKLKNEAHKTKEA